MLHCDRQQRTQCCPLEQIRICPGGSRISPGVGPIIPKNFGILLGVWGSRLEFFVSE